MTTSQAFTTTLEDGILMVVVDSTEPTGSASMDIRAEFDEILDGAERDKQVRAVVLTGSGEDFCAGHDLEARLAATSANDPEGLPRERSLPRAWYFSKPFIAGVHGTVGTEGVHLTAASDFIIAAEDTQWNFDLAHLGGGTPSGSYTILHFQLPMRVLNKLWLMNGFLEASEALRWNFVQRVVPRDEVAQEATRWAREAAKIQYEQYSASKASVRRVYEILGLNAAVGVQNMGTGRGSKADIEFWETVKQHGLRAALDGRDEGFDDDIARI